MDEKSSKKSEFYRKFLASSFSPSKRCLVEGTSYFNNVHGGDGDDHDVHHGDGDVDDDGDGGDHDVVGDQCLTHDQ